MPVSWIVEPSRIPSIHTEERGYARFDETLMSVGQVRIGARDACKGVSGEYGAVVIDTLIEI